MSQPSRSRSRGKAQRVSRDVKLERPVPLEERKLMAPVVATYPLQVAFTESDPQTNQDLGTVTVSANTTTTSIGTMAPITSVSELTSVASFGGQIVTIAAGPGGVFGNDVYAVTRGAGDNADEGAVNNPGVIYRVDPATGQASVFFDLNTVINQYDSADTTPSTPAANGLLTSSGLVNWYSITFDSEGVFSGTPAMFVSSVSRSDPSKNIIFEIAPNGTLMGIFTQMTDGLSSMNFNLSPTAILIPPVQDQSFLSGLIGGSGISSVGGTFAALYFAADSYSPGQEISNSTLPSGVSETNLGEPVVAEVATAPGSVGTTLVNTGPIVGLTAANSDYPDPIYSIFTDFGTPAAGLIPATPGYSGIQGSSGDLLIGGGSTPIDTTATGNIETQGYPAVATPFRRFQSVAFDQYGYFSQGLVLGSTSTSSTTGGSGTTTYTIASQEPAYGGSLFVSDLASGLYVTVTPLAPLPTAPILVPVQGSGIIGVTTDASGAVIPIITDGNSTDGANDAGGQILRVLPDGSVNTFAYGFDTSAAQDYTSFINSSFTISFSADGTALYASDDQGIWQFKTTADLASSTSGTLVGLNDLRTLGVPYDGQNSAVAVVDTGVDANVTSFRGRVAGGTDIFTGGLGNDDLAPTSSSSTTGGTGGTGGGTGTGGSTTLSNSVDGHGTPVAGIIAQFVPQATLVPVNIFVPFLVPAALSGSSSTGGTGGTGGGSSGGSSSGASLSGTANALTDSNELYNGLQYVITHPFSNDPLRPGKVDRIVAASFAFGTGQTFQSEVDAYKNYPQVVIALKNAYHKFLKEGIAPIAASGEFGAPLGSGSSSTSGTGGTGGSSGSTGGTSSLTGANNSTNSAVGDSNGMSLPAVLDEVISVTGVYSFPYDLTPASPPTDQPVTVLGRETYGPVLLLGSSATLGGTASTGSGSTGGTTTSTGYDANAQLLAAGDYEIYANRMLGSANRSNVTDFAAPAINVPTFRRQFSTTTSSTTAGTSSASPTNSLTFNFVGTSASEAIVTGAYALVSSALNYWTNLAKSSGYTADAYLNTPVGTDTLNFGKRAFENVTAWNTPNGINGILAWTADPATDANDGGSVSTPSTLPGGTTYRSYATVNVANAVAAIEGTEAIKYLTAHHDWNYIDVNHDGVITAQEVTNFVDSANADGMPEAGAMAALLGGTATYSAVEPGLNNEVFNENPDDPGAEQRRFNFYDYAADGQLNGSVTINEFKLLGRILLPSPDAYDVTDRQRASANGFLLNPTAQRDFVALQHTLPTYQWVSKAEVKKYRNISPAQFGVGKNQTPGTYFPLYTLFDPMKGSASANTKTVVAGSKTAVVDGASITVDWLSAVPNSTVASTASTSTSSTGTTTLAASTDDVSTTTAANSTTTSTTSGTSTPTSSPTSTPTPTPTPTPTSTQSLIDAAIALSQQNASASTGGTSSSTTSGSSSGITNG